MINERFPFRFKQIPPFGKYLGGQVRRWREMAQDKGGRQSTCHAHKRFSRVKRNKLRLNKGIACHFNSKAVRYWPGTDIDNAGVYTPLTA